MSNIVKKKDLDSYAVYNMLFGHSKSKLRTFSVSAFWREKIVIIVQFLQLFALCFAANYENWPEYWRGLYGYSGLWVFSGDLGSFLYDDILGDSTGRYIYASFWFFLALLMITIYLLVRFTCVLMASVRLKFEMAYFSISHLLYLPIALGLMPVAICRYDSCWESSWEIAYSALQILVVFTFLIAMPIYLWHHAYRLLSTPDPDEHENYIKLREFEYILQISHIWLMDKFFLFSSFKRSHLRVYHLPLLQFFICAMVFVHSVLQTEYATKLLILLAMTLIFALYVSWYPVYRCGSSSVLYAFTWWILTTNFLIGYLKAEGFDSQTLVDSNMTQLLLAINVCCGASILLMLAVFILFRLHWPVHLEKVQQLANGYRFLLNDLRNAQSMILQLLTMTTYQFVRPDTIRGMIELIEKHYKLLYKEEHPLQFTTLEQLDGLYYLKKRVLEQTLLPSKSLEEHYDLLIKVISRRWNEQLLMKPKRRRMLLKLTVLKMFLGNRATEPFGIFDEKKPGKTMDDDEITSLELNTPYRSETPKSFKSADDEQAVFIKRIQTAFESRDPNLLAALTDEAINHPFPSQLPMLQAIWRDVGIEFMPENMRNVLFADLT